MRSVANPCKRITFRIRTRLETPGPLLSIAGYRGQKPLGKVAELYGGGHWEYLTEDLFPAAAAQPLNSNPRGLKKIRSCYALTRTDAIQLRHTESIRWRVRLRPPAVFTLSTVRILR